MIDWDRYHVEVLSICDGKIGELNRELKEMFEDFRKTNSSRMEIEFVTDSGFGK